MVRAPSLNNNYTCFPTDNKCSGRIRLLLKGNNESLRIILRLMDKVFKDRSLLRMFVKCKINSPWIKMSLWSLEIKLGLLDRLQMQYSNQLIYTRPKALASKEVDRSIRAFSNMQMSNKLTTIVFLSIWWIIRLTLTRPCKESSQTWRATD